MFEERADVAWPTRNRLKMIDIALNVGEFVEVAWSVKIATGLP